MTRGHMTREGTGARGVTGSGKSPSHHPLLSHLAFPCRARHEDDWGRVRFDTFIIIIWTNWSAKTVSNDWKWNEKFTIFFFMLNRRHTSCPPLQPRLVYGKKPDFERVYRHRTKIDCPNKRTCARSGTGSPLLLADLYNIWFEQRPHNCWFNSPN